MVGAGAPLGVGPPGVGATDELGDAELEAPAALSLPTAGGLLGEIVARGTPPGCSSAAPCTESPELPNNAPAAQMMTRTTTAEPMVATVRRRRYTEG